MSVKHKTARREARKLIGKKVFLTKRDAQSSKLIEGGVRSGFVVRGIPSFSASDGNFDFEIDIGGAGAPKFVVLPRKAFVLQTPKKAPERTGETLSEKEKEFIDSS